MDGHGRLAYLPDGKERHLAMCHGKAVVVIYMPPKGHLKHGKIITVLPQEAAMPKAKNSPATKHNSRRASPGARAPKKNRQRRGY